MESLAISQPALTEPFRVGEWLAEPMANRLTRGDEVQRLEPKVMEVLACMASRPGETVTKEEFMDEVWAGTIVTDDVLARCISELRKALGDSARNPEYVETIRKRGYVLIAPVERGAEVRTPETQDAPLTDARPAVSPSAARARAQTRQRVRTVVLAAVVLALVALTAAIAYRVATDRVVPLPALPVTSSPGEERDPALSPDGATVAFSWKKDESSSYDVYIQDIEGGSPVRITSSPADERSPAWSPDGSRLAFARCTPGGCALLTVGAESDAEPVELVDLGTAQVQDLMWSPDGLKLVFSARKGSQGVYAVHLIALDGSPPQRLTVPPSIYPGDLDPAFSPDGETLAFVRTTLDGRQDVCLVSVEGGEVERLAREQKGVTGLDWTTDGREVVYAANRDGVAGLWRVRRTGGAPRWVALGVDGGEVSSPSTSRGAAGIAFARQMVRSHVAEIQPGQEQARVIVRSTREDAHPAVSPDGQKIAFVSQRSGSHEVWVASSRGEDPQRLTNFGGPRVATPRWSPDGELLALSAREENADADIFIIGEGGVERRLTDDPADDVAPAWSHDGRWLYFASNRDGDWQIYRLTLDSGGEPERVTLYGGVAAAEGPDGTLLVVRGEQDGLWRLRLGENGLPLDQQAVPLRTRLSPAEWTNWTVEGDYVYVIERRADGAVAIIRLDPRTQEREFIASLTTVPDQPGLAVFPGARRFLLSQSERSDSDIVLVRDFE